MFSGSCELCSHPWWTMKRDWVGPRLGWKRSGLGHSPAGRKHLSRSLWHQNPILKHVQYVLPHSELKPKCSLWLYPTNTSLPTSLNSSPTTHQPSQLQQGYPTYIFPPNRHSSTPGPFHIPSLFLEHVAPRISGAPISLTFTGISSNVTVPEKPSLATSYKQAILYSPCFVFFLSTSTTRPLILCMYVCMYLKSWYLP